MLIQFCVLHGTLKFSKTWGNVVQNCIEVGYIPLLVHLLAHFIFPMGMLHKMQINCIEIVLTVPEIQLGR